MGESELERLRKKIEEVNFKLLDELSKRARFAEDILRLKGDSGQPIFDPAREQEMLAGLIAKNEGPFDDASVREIFKTIFSATARLMKTQKERVLTTSRSHRAEDIVVGIGHAQLGTEQIQLGLMAPPLSKASHIERFVAQIQEIGVAWLQLRSGTPSRALWQRACGEAGLGYSVVADDLRGLDALIEGASALRVPGRSMYDYELLKELGKCQLPILLERAASATLSEWMWSAEYIARGKNQKIIFCEAGIEAPEADRTPVLDVSAIAVLRQKSYLPVIASLESYRDSSAVLTGVARGALAAGACGLVMALPRCEQKSSVNECEVDLGRLVRFMLDTGVMSQPVYSATARRLLADRG